MRKALNENPMVQIAVIGLIAVIFAVILFTMVLKKEEPAAPEAADPAAATATATDPAAAAPAPVTPAPSTVPAPAPGGEAPAEAAELAPTEGLPADVVRAYEGNAAVALLVVDPKGLADEQVELFTRPLAERSDVEVFVVEVKDIADYSRITSGVAVSRSPALVVVQPRRLSDGAPTATVSYGFRSEKSIEQALEDALYEGKPIPSHP